MTKEAWQRNQNTYDIIAPQFAEINSQMPAALVERAASLLARMPPAGRILDLGCGAGRDLTWFEARGARMMGVDLSVGMLSQAQMLTVVPLYQMEMRRLGFPAYFFNAVWCNAALLHLPKVEAPEALTEIARVLVQDGLLYLSVQEGDAEGEESGPYPGISRFFARYRAGEMTSMLELAGFRILGQGTNQSHRAWLWFETIRS